MSRSTCCSRTPGAVTDWGSVLFEHALTVCADYTLCERARPGGQTHLGF